MESLNRSHSTIDYKETFDIYYKSLVSYAGRFLPLLDECEDLVQDVFVSLWENKNIFPDEVSLKVFLYKSVRNKCFNVLKHTKVKDNYIISSDENEAQEEYEFLEQVLEEEIVRQLYQAIELLPERKKEIIKLSLKGLKNNEIAEILEIKLQTVKTLKSQSYTILRQQFHDLESILYFLLF